MTYNYDPRYVFGAWVERVVDGDTIDVTLDRGHNLHEGHARVRLWGIDTPEVRRGSWCKGLTEEQIQAELERAKAASAFVKEHCPAGTHVILASHKTSETGKFGRYLYVVWLSLDSFGVIEESINGQLALQGLADPYKPEPLPIAWPEKPVE